MTAPIVLPDYGAQFAEALANLGKGAATVINPHGADRAAFRKAAAANPAILQQFRDLAEIQGYTETFTAIKNFVPQDLLDVITNLEPSPEARIRKAGARAVEQAPGEQLSALGVADIMRLPPLEAARQLALAPAVTRVAGMEPGQVGATLAERGASRVLTGEAPEEGAAGVIQGDLVRLAGTYLGALPPERKAQLGAYQAMPTLMADDHFMKQLALQERMFEARNQDRVSEMMLRLHEQDIMNWAHKTRVGTTDGWRTFFSDKGRKRLEQLSGEDPRRPVTALTAEDRELLDIQRAFQAAPFEEKSLDINRADIAITRLRTAIAKESNASVRAGHIIALNNQLLYRARITGGPPLHAAWAVSEKMRDVERQRPGDPLAGLIAPLTRKLRFFDESGNEISPESIEALSEIAPVNQRGAPSAPGGEPLTPRPQDRQAPLQSPIMARAAARARELQLEGSRNGLEGQALRNWILVRMKQEGFNVQ